jgi:hypothetical protein
MFVDSLCNGKSGGAALGGGEFMTLMSGGTDVLIFVVGEVVRLRVGELDAEWNESGESGVSGAWSVIEG